MSARRLLIALVLGLSCVVLMLATSKRGPSSTADVKPAALEEPALTPPAAPITPVVLSAATSGSKQGQSCEQVCGASAKLGCRKAAACKTSCEAMASTGVCQLQLATFFECLKAQPSEHWECLEDGTGAIRESYCDSEQASFAACLQEKQL